MRGDELGFIAGLAPEKLDSLVSGDFPAGDSGEHLFFLKGSRSCRRF